MTRTRYYRRDGDECAFPQPGKPTLRAIRAERFQWEFWLKKFKANIAAHEENFQDGIASFLQPIAEKIEAALGFEETGLGKDRSVAGLVEVVLESEEANFIEAKIDLTPQITRPNKPTREQKSKKTREKKQKQEVDRIAMTRAIRDDKQLNDAYQRLREKGEIV